MRALLLRAWRWRHVLLSAVVCGLLGVAGCGPNGPVKLGDPAEWTAHPADGVSLDLSGDQGALRMDFAFKGSGWAIARRQVDLDLPDNYAFRFRLRGQGPANDLEFKLIDDSGDNVWWHVERDVVWPSQWRTITIKKRQLAFAWGPRGGGDITHVAAIEFAVTAGNGGTGTVWIDGLELVPLPDATGPLPPLVATASSQAEGHDPGSVLDDEPNTFWAAAAGDPQPWLELDCGRSREFGGLSVEWAPGRQATDYVVEGSDDRRTWATLQQVTGGNGGLDPLYLPDNQWRYLRLRMTAWAGDSGPAITGMTLQPVAWSATRETFFMNIAARARPGLYPRGFLDEPSFWTVVGVDRDDREGLLGADGAVETGPGGFSLEPFLATGGRLLTWHDVTARQTLADGDLPIPTVTWECPPWRLEITALGTGDPGRSSILVRYRLENRGAAADSATLYLAVRPFQVNPPSQFLNLRGGTARVDSIARQGRTIVVDGRPRVLLLRDPDAFGATTFAGGDVVAAYLEAGHLPPSNRVADPFGAASAAAAFSVKVSPGKAEGVDVLIPLHRESPLAVGMDADAALAAAVAGWRQVRDRVVIQGPPAAADFLATLKAQLGWILVNRAGVAIQPGARSYARSWIRDGALTGEALLRLGHFKEVRDFLTWFAPYQYPDGKVPCVVDQRGPDPVPEHDSTGEFIALVTQYYRYTHDLEFLRTMWPRILAGVDYLESLLAEGRTPENQTADRREFYGILPPSISHEGYSAKPMHSYWDDFWTLRGLKDAAWAAGELEDEKADSLAVLRDRFATDLKASIPAAMSRHGIDYVPGCADLGDFDATSTTIALDPAAAEDLLPAGALVETFTRYWDFFAARRGGEPWVAFTPYEIRTIGAVVRLGWRERARELGDFFLAHRTPPGWRQWAEVVARDSLKARFIGDMPHTWVGSDFIRSGLDMFAYELRAEEPGGPSLVLAAGLPGTWLADGGVTVGGLPTPYGPLSYHLNAAGDDVLMTIAGGVTIPDGGLILDPPIRNRRPFIAGIAAATDSLGRVLVRDPPVTVRWRR